VKESEPPIMLKAESFFGQEAGRRKNDADFIGEHLTKQGTLENTYEQ
jgi:hypothetical protein